MPLLSPGAEAVPARADPVLRAFLARRAQGSEPTASQGSNGQNLTSATTASTGAEAQGS
jgi:hypothetical protein